MKHRVSISVDEETIIRVREALRQKRFRNKSHAFESALNDMLNKIDIGEMYR